MRFNLLPLLLLLVNPLFSQERHDPTFEEIISLKGITNPKISPDGQDILYQGRTTDWEGNRFDTEIWLSRKGNKPIQLTNNPKKSSTNPQWSPDGNWITYISDNGGKSQIQIMNSQGGASFQLTEAKNGVSDYQWSPDSKRIAFRTSQDRSKETKSREDKYGAYAVEDEEYSLNELYLIDFKPEWLGRDLLPQESDDSVLTKSFEPTKLIDSITFSVNDFEWSPDGKMIAFEHQPDPTLISMMKRDIAVYNLETKSYKTIVANKGADALETWSPDSKSILYVTNLDDIESNFYKNPRYYRIDHDGANNKQLASTFDEELYNVIWTDNGIFAVAWQKTVRSFLRVNPENGKAKILLNNPARIWSFSFSKNGNRIALSGSQDNSVAEIYTSDFPIKDLTKVTNSSNQLNTLLVAQSEVISWPSEDGTQIEGILHKPMNYDPNKKYPLLLVIHGGPTGISSPHPAPAYVYPIVQWLNKGALVLRPNYRGSGGYGEAFRSLNVENLGVGDMWDVMSGIKYLEDKGIIDGDKVGAMGWSQGGYISAFLTTNTDKFKAISVGAGISNWMTYYVNTDIHPFTRQYLKATPWSDKDIYEKTSPMTNINNAKTPTLIQHGEFDRRVPTPNGYELFQGLQDVGVETKLIIYKGFGHGITKPRERLAAMWHNWQWFSKYIWEEEIEIPE